jgi:hypothetical protein
MRLGLGLLLLAGCGSSTTAPKMTDAITIKTDEFTVPAGGEVFVCQDFKNPFGAVDMDVQAIDSHMTPGSHHMFAFYSDNAVDTSLSGCSGLEFGPALYGTQSPESTIVLPEGTGLLLKGTQGLHLSMHYLNASKSDLKSQVTLVLHKAKANTVTQHAGVFFFDNIRGINVPPQTMKTVSATCASKKDASMLYATGHMHQFSTAMTVTVNGQTIYSNDSWASAPWQAYDPPLAIPVGTQITWSSTINNTTGNTLTFGESAQTNEMSIFTGLYAPADVNNPTYECNR